MKVLVIIAIALGAAAVGTGVYSLVETYPNYSAARSRYERHAGRSSFRADLDWSLYRSYENALKMQIVLGQWGAGGLALIFGIIGVIKKRKLGFIPIALSLGAVAISLMVQPAHW
jgi:hypothetical protein